MSIHRPVLETLDPEKRKVLLDSGALLEGHFILTSGRHSAFYFQGMRLLQHPQLAERAARDVAGMLKGRKVDAVFAPAVGGIVWGYEMARQFPGARAIFAERVDGKMALRRNFEIRAGEKILLAEDVTTTGGSVMELKVLAEAAGAQVVAVATVLNRSGGAFQPGVDLVSWVEMSIESWEADKIPPELAAIPVTKPGSRGLK